MVDVVIEQKDNIHLCVHCEPAIAQELSDYFTFQVPGASFSPQYRKRQWDGKIRLYSLKTQQIYVGLLPYVEEFCKVNGYSYTSTLSKTEIVGKPDQKFIDSLNLPKSITPRDYQLNAFGLAIQKQRAVIVSPTASGKSLMIYLISRFLLSRGKKRGLLIVPTVSLVHQMVGDFAEYGWDVDNNCQMIYEGQLKEPTGNLVVSTWQSIYEMPKAYFKKFDFIIGDEAHTFKAKSLTSIMNKLVNCDYRIGTTGTLDGTKVHKLVLEGLFGAVRKIISTKELMDRKQIASLRIKCLVLKHKDDICKNLTSMTYNEEIEYLIGCEARNKFIRNLVSALEGNTMILYTRVAMHGQVLYDMFREHEALKGRKIFFIHGNVDVEDREAARHITETQENAIIIASYGTFSTGINIKNLHNVVFASPTKSRIRNLQSIGRGLRLGDKKKEATLYDIADDLRYKEYVNYTLDHYASRIETYSGEFFSFKIYNIGLV